MMMAVTATVTRKDDDGRPVMAAATAFVHVTDDGCDGDAGNDGDDYGSLRDRGLT